MVRLNARPDGNFARSCETVNVVGMKELLDTQSAVDPAGRLREHGVDGVQFRPTRPVAHPDGHVTEVARTSWDIIEQPIVQVHCTTTLPGRVRAWGLHQLGTDRLFVVSGLIRFAVFDGREGSPTFGRVADYLV